MWPVCRLGLISIWSPGNIVLATRHNWWLEEVHAGVCHAVTTTGAAHGTVRLSWEPAMRELMILSELIDHIRNSLVPRPLDASAVWDLEVNCVFFEQNDAIQLKVL